MKIITKICTKCKTEKPTSKFHKRKNGRFGVKAICSVCCNTYSLAWREVNREKHRTSNKTWRHANKEKHNASRRALDKRKRKIDARFKLNRNMSRAIHLSLKNGKGGKHWETLVDYTMADLKKI